jgi:uncharacterized repeat protein (TIGR03803 family)
MRVSCTFALLILSTAAACSQRTGSSTLPALPVTSFAREVPMAGSFKSLYSFKGNPDGQNPYSGMVALKGTLYGTTELGGKYDFGVLYKVSTLGAEHVLHTFGNPSNTDGSDPYGALVVLDGALYGTTYYGGRAPADYGTVYKATLAGVEHPVCSFTSSQGEDPYAGVVALNGTLYGADYQGGTKNYGTVYGCSTSGKVRVLHSFMLAPDGAYPYSPPVALGGALYGTTYQGGTKNSTYGYGTVYKVTTSGEEHVLHRFTGYPKDGSYPYARLLVVGGKLYGTTAHGGTSNYGTVFEITPSGTEHVIYSFKGGADGAGPQAGLIAVNGTLYGTTSSGGQSNDGTVYKVTTSGKELVLHSFTGVAPDGANPLGGLVNVNGELYGTTFYGGKYDDGVIFKIAP